MEGKTEDSVLRQQGEQLGEEEDLRIAGHPVPRSRNQDPEHRRIRFQLHLKCPVRLGQEGAIEEKPPSTSLSDHNTDLSSRYERRALLRYGEKQQYAVYFLNIFGGSG